MSTTNPKWAGTGFARNYALEGTEPIPYTMAIETAQGIKPLGFHLGTDIAIAEQFAIEATGRPCVRTVALYQGPKLVRMFDFRDL